MKEPGLYSFNKAYLAESMAVIAFKQPKLRQTCIEWFDDIITFAIEKLPEVQYIDGVLAGSLTSFIMDLQASELLPKLKAMYDTGCVDQMACGSFDKVEKGFTEKENVQHFNLFKIDIYELFATLKSRFNRQ